MRLSTTTVATAAVTLGFAALATACMSQQDQDRAAADVLAINGYTDVRVTGPALVGCSRDDDYIRGFRASAPNGQRVRGVVCGGWQKAWTVRITAVRRADHWVSL